MQKNFHQLLLDTTEAEPAPVQDQPKTKYETECQQFKHATEEPLPFAMRQSLLREIETHPDIVKYFELTPSTLPGLVMNNQHVAIPVLLGLMEQGDISDLLDALVEMEVSINTMEVINRYAQEDS